MKLLVKMKFGSHVYGTNVPTSDQDYKAVYLPDAKDILLQKAKNIIHENTNGDGSKNSAQDVDTEYISVQRYLELLCEGQTVALDMLFCPDKFIVEGSDIGLWKIIKLNKDRFLHSGVLSFIGYCRTQANKYGIKGSRMKAIKESLELFEKLKTDKELYSKVRLENVEYNSLTKNDHINLTVCKAANGKEELHLEICNRKFGMRTKIEYVVDTLNKIYDGYGHRAKLAEQNDGIDWKALMHAVRVQCEARELLTTGTISFPRPEKELLLKIRKGEMDYKDVAKIIEEGLEELEGMESSLPPKPDREYMENLVCIIHEEIIRRAE